MRIDRYKYSVQILEYTDTFSHTIFNNDLHLLYYFKKYTYGILFTASNTAFLLYYFEKYFFFLFHYKTTLFTHNSKFQSFLKFYFLILQ